MAKTKQTTVKPLAPISLPIVIGILALLVAVFYWKHLTGSAFLWEDFVEQEFPFRTLAASSLADGVIPHWNPYIFCGMPFLADVQVAFWYPANMLQTLFVSNGHLSPVIMQWFIIIHYLIAGVGMYLLVRTVFKTDEWSALLAAIAYAFSGYLSMQIIHQMIIYHLALFPFIVLLYIKGIDSMRHALGAGLMLGAMYLAGHPQSTLYLTFFLAFLALYEIGYRLRKKDEPIGITQFAAMIVPVLIGVGIYAVQLLPSQELAGLSRRDVMTYDLSVSGGQISFGSILTYIMPRLFGLTDALRQAKVPFWNGEYFFSWETALYIGVIPFALGIFASVLRSGKKYVLFFSLFGLFALLFSMGENFFIYKIFFSLPLFGNFRAPARMLMLATFTLTALSGVGLSALLAGEAEQKKKILLLISGIIVLMWVLAVGGVFSAKSFRPDAPSEANASISWAAGLAAFPVIALICISLAVMKNMLRGTTLAFSIISVTVIELFLYGMSVNAAADDPRTIYAERQQLVDELKQDQSKELSRANIRLQGASLLRRNQGAYDRIQLLEGYNPLVLAQFAPECANSAMTMDILNIKHRVMPSGDRIGFGAVSTYLPRAKMYYSLDVRTAEQAKSALKDSTYDYHNTLLLEEKPTLEISGVDSNPTVKFIRYQQNEIEIEVTTASNGMLFLSEVYYPSWHAEIDGKPAKIYKAFTTLRAVEVPVGKHIISLRFESDSFSRGKYITLSVLLITFGAFGFLQMKKRK